MIYGLYRFFKKRVDIFIKNYSNETMRRYFVKNGIDVDFSTLIIPPTTKIYAESNFHLGGGYNFR